MPRARNRPLTELAHHLDGAEFARELGAVQVMGELSEWSVARSGHAYFTISDGRSSMRCILWKDRLRSLAWQPQAGEQVLINGRAQVYTKSGSASFETYAMA